MTIHHMEYVTNKRVHEEHSHKGVSGAAIANFRFGNFLSESPKDF